MSIPNIEYTEFKELEGKLNAYLCMCFEDKTSVSLKELLDFIENQSITEREKLHLSVSAILTINKLNYSILFLQ